MFYKVSHFEDIKILTNCRSFGGGFEPRYIFGAEPLDQ